jgi:hypothetical protein
MGKTIVKHEDVDKLYDALVEEMQFDENMSVKAFHNLVEEIFGVTLPIESESGENKECFHHPV